MHIRKASTADYDRLVAIDTLASGQQARRRQIRAWIEAGGCDVVQAGDLVCAYGVLHYHFFSHGFIDMVMVGADFRRQGYGVALVRHFQQLCTTSRLFSSTNASNQAMQKLLRGAGFRSSGYIDNLDDNDAEMVFCCDVA